ncbi:hypothetical protein F383_06278 [Gossypium arboreum]|uniref:Uncharacterized protein n=1 Tax=Gossypium arboreum TaxID=29729 RepID=A0A0B0NVI0_GOSAR|nr:hypothetical protein F383_06278 [Gossypium arboreum]
MAIGSCCNVIEEKGFQVPTPEVQCCCC